MEELISVIVPVYNSQKTLRTCVCSILNQTYVLFELILVDDGSSDGSSVICDDFEQKDPRVRTVHQKNAGVSAARNVGLSIAKGNYIAFVDSDDIIAPTNFAVLYDLLQKVPEAGFSACNHNLVTKTKCEPVFRGKGIYVFSRKEAYESVLYHGAVDVSPWGKLYRKQVLQGLQYPEGKLYEDTWLFGSILDRSTSMIYTAEALYYYQLDQPSIVRGNFFEKRLQYISAVEKLCQHAFLCDNALEKGCERRLVHAFLSVLRYMEDCEAKYLPLRKELRRKAVEHAFAILCNKSAPKRDKVALIMLLFGFRTFYISWGLYSKYR